MQRTRDEAWWHSAVVYQIYPRSFFDSNDDGIGDLRGIISKLDYLAGLGVDVLWLCPVYQSPMEDMGYDISDYYRIAPEYGSMEDMEALIALAGERGMRILMDLVVHHTSDAHPWFMQAAADRDSEYREFYVWRDRPEPAMDSIFGGSAWTLNPGTGDYYLHTFSRHQPDLNWHSPRLREAVYRMMDFWVKKGIGGFRIDVMDMLGKDIDGGQLRETEETYRIIREMSKRTFGPHHLLTVGEASSVSTESAIRYAPLDGSGLSMVFQFEHMHLDRAGSRDKWHSIPFDFIRFKRIMSDWQAIKGKAWGSLYLNNHDQPRALSRWGNDGEHRVRCAKMHAVLLHMMWGTPFIYQGEEIGMTNARMDDLSDYRDLDSIRACHAMAGEGLPEHEIMARLMYRSRDNARTPMQWSDEENAGFSGAEPWIRVNPGYPRVNAERDMADMDGVYHFYRRLIALRKQKEAIVYGEYELLLAEDPEIFCYLRHGRDETLLVVCNFFGGQPQLTLPGKLREAEATLVISNYPDVPGLKGGCRLRPYEAFVLSLPPL